MKAEYYLLQDEDKEAQGFHRLTFEQIDDIGFSILDNVLSGEVIDDSWIPIRSILYRLLELNDTLSVLIANSVVSTAFPITRYEFELLLQLSFMLSDSETLSEKSMMYYYCDVRQRFAPHDKELLIDHMTNSKLFSELHTRVLAIKGNERMSWYSLYENRKITLKGLSEIVGLDKQYLQLYPHLSSDIHGSSCLEANTKCFEDGGKYYLRHFRLFERHHTVMTQHIDFMRRVFKLFPKVFDVSQELEDKIDDFYTRADGYVETYKSIKNSAIDPLADFAM
ncbi:DUF5677 domain-containing protein [Vibrio parahaemolyticus]|uniref:DUF5677 domain-containing protein n=2 Tax=Vibrio parahaemolyticus TaxID=670 RepID=UPI00235FF1D3|nr:DUF5677 domain-containing protein [Vibrio parahaemolyticus]EHH1106675.1 hypothetical protein [Vibrio parahaemolyticus]EHH1935541.1 hypothetical protein [Vibrio parahaemolyticus]EIE1198962.1 hypothetical protein [Vibrio parahaemolyticus]EIZ1043107.1 hypothetical protein [Vibrio parahaemolyticus]EJC6989841.1 hypothetical protein [Vibrio parahaemolyticus]